MEGIMRLFTKPHFSEEGWGFVFGYFGGIGDLPQ
jgi:hypothetical protein